MYLLSDQVGYTPKKKIIEGSLLGNPTAHIECRYRCFLPDLTGFAIPRCVRPSKLPSLI